MAKTDAKKGELDEDVAKLTTKIDAAMAKSATLKEEIKALQAELAALAKEQASMDKIRGEQNAAYTEAKSDLELGLGGVRKALEVLRAYYGGAAASALLQTKDSEGAFGSFMQQPAPPKSHSKAEGAGQGIIDILEVVESDFASDLAKIEQEESDSVAEYEKLTQDNKVTKAAKDQDVKYKTQEAAGLDKAADELKADEESASTELASVMDYYAEVKERCIAKPESYEDRAAKRQSEIDGLKEALTVLETEAAFLQHQRRGRRGHGRRNMRGGAAHLAAF
jgi:chromosome segregation ATPase